ncbi:hypothetical protein JCM12294_45030 [Desulfocicer niacini]
MAGIEKMKKYFRKEIFYSLKIFDTLFIIFVFLKKIVFVDESHRQIKILLFQYLIIIPNKLIDIFIVIP